jgi:chemotaxis protein methyltransferase CheR
LAFARGDYSAVLALAGALPDPAAAALCVRAVANEKGAVEAERMVRAAIERHPRAEELQLLRAVLLMDLGRHKEAVHAARRALYLDRALAMGHFLLGSALARVDDRAGAHQAFRNARTLCAQLPPDTPVRFADGERAARLAEAAEAQLELLAPRRAS